MHSCPGAVRDSARPQGPHAWLECLGVAAHAADGIEGPAPRTGAGPTKRTGRDLVERVAAAGCRRPPERVPATRHLPSRRADEEKPLRVPIRIAALLAVAGLSVAACASTSNGSGSTDGDAPVGSPSAHPSGPGSTRVPTRISEPSSAAAPTSSAPKPKPVRVSLLESDGGVYGVGMSIIAWFTRAPTDASAFDQAVTVTVNGTPAGGPWYWKKSAHAGAVVEPHYRPQHYWPAPAQIRMTAPLKGVSAGRGPAFDDSPTLSISTGARTSRPSTATPNA